MNIFMSSKFWLWLLMIVYVAALPYMIIPFLWLEQTLSLSTVRKLPYIIIGMIACAYLWRCRKQQKGYHLTTFIIPTLLLLTGVVFLESNSIKYIHIPEYMILVWLLFYALSNAHSNRYVLFTAIFCAIILGMVDEVHQGLHPTRYYGWKDMLINSVGSIIGALSINALTVDNGAAPTKRLILSSQLAIVIISALTAILFLYLLLLLAENPTRHYSAANVMISLIVISLSIYSTIKCRSTSTFYYPIILLTILHTLIIFASQSTIPFR